MPAELRFLSVEDVLQIQEDTVQIEGGRPGLLDPKLLESAVMTPPQRYEGRYLHEDVAAMAAAYLYHLCQNHAFHDGNKRAAAFSTVIFLHVNGFAIPEPVDLESVTLRIASSTMDKGEVTEWIRSIVGEHPTNA